ncbi:unnamed protein product [Protopolystoma xenopodis]|uniref:Uncharacterized protein n=1 Tax=Protopolystoma xenopodis TaxID=117903 RepID=A0A3S4ZZN6_9PLAT|nr:unnamed protein product [Protopolystoma xenopodis]
MCLTTWRSTPCHLQTEKNQSNVMNGFYERNNNLASQISSHYPTLNGSKGASPISISNGPRHGSSGKNSSLINSGGGKCSPAGGSGFSDRGSNGSTRFRLPLEIPTLKAAQNPVWSSDLVESDRSWLSKSLIIIANVSLIKLIIARSELPHYDLLKLELKVENYFNIGLILPIYHSNYFNLVQSYVKA